MKWSNKDWFWLFAVIIYACGLSFLYKSEVMNIISYVSTFVSIALGGVAIYISVREATKTEKVKDEISFILGEMKEKIGQVDNKVSGLDLSAMSRTIDEKMNEVVNTFKTKIDAQGETFDKTAIKFMLENELNKKAKEIKEDINDVVLEGSNSSKRMIFRVFLEPDSNNFSFKPFVMQAREILGVHKEYLLFKNIATEDDKVATIQAIVRPKCNISRNDILNAFNSLKEAYKISSIE
ncbi:hypothetical protein SAMN04487896_3178 [Paenibacillus sp. ov031]|uniref:hypothetical protein n=1 Tax=Paenibacillus sp. ov031 TaxID=1761879 RepID=UPI00090FD5F4|nr:hypothetical protein [Paenibacillus sp. ov031]SHN73277.1 hypothetical protein SAMN04487896_3178 [Paenibacillus sp. ov031]